MVDARKWQVSVHTAQPFALRGVGFSFLRLEKSAMETTEEYPSGVPALTG